MKHANPSNADDNRSSEMEDVHAGWSQALKLLLRKFSMHESGPARGGIPFTVGDQTYTIHAKVSDIISDGDGHRQGLEWVGAGGLRCCLLHANVFGKRSGMDDHEDVLITCLEPAADCKTTTPITSRLVAMCLLAQKLFRTRTGATTGAVLFQRFGHRIRRRARP